MERLSQTSQTHFSGNFLLPFGLLIITPMSFMEVFILIILNLKFSDCGNMKFMLLRYLHSNMDYLQASTIFKNYEGGIVVLDINYIMPIAMPRQIVTIIWNRHQNFIFLQTYTEHFGLFLKVQSFSQDLENFKK